MLQARNDIASYLLERDPDEYTSVNSVRGFKILNKPRFRTSSQKEFQGHNVNDLQKSSSQMFISAFDYGQINFDKVISQ